MVRPCICIKSGVTTVASLMAFGFASAAFAGSACGPDAGSCNEANGTPGCDDVECCEAVCAADSFCCETEWDGACVNLALELCGGKGGVCAPGAGDCSVPNGTPGCEDVDCCELICGQDPFCCDTEWDQICADAANAQCGEPCDVECPAGAQIEAEPCGSDTNGGCNSTPVAFEDSSCGSTICGTGWAEADTRDTDWYLISVSDDDADGSAEIVATLNSEFSGVVFVIDGIGSCTPVVVGETGASVSCEAGVATACVAAPGDYVVFVAPSVFAGIPCGGGNNDYVVSIACNDTCDLPPSPCNPDAGPCDAPNGSPGCDDIECCELICAQDPFCCDTEWDQICADAAIAQCFTEPCDVECPAGAQIEAEACGSDTNGGCNSTPVLFEDTTCGATICGTGWADGGTRDTDWFIFDVADDCTQVTAVLASEFPGVTFILGGIDICSPVVLGQAGDSANCAAGLPAIAEVSAGSYVLFVAPSGFEGAPCGGNNDYVVTMTCGECAPPVECPCPAGSTIEPEACGDDTNGGCNSTPAVFGDIACGETICGTGWADGGTRDTDWYQVTTDAECTRLTSTLTSAFDGVTFVLDGIDICAPAVIGATGASNGCVAGAPAVADVGPGTYVIFVAPNVFEGVPCGTDNDYHVTLTCEDCVIEPPPANDDCADRIEILEGATDYDTTSATTDGLPHLECMFDGQTYQDIWYNYTATVDGTLTVSTCGTAQYDTDLAVYDGCDTADCPPGDDLLLACNDDAEGCPDFSSELTIDVTCGNCYKIRVGGWNDGDAGTGTVTLTAAGTPCDCTWDLDGDGTVGPSDLAILLANWNNPYGPADLAALLAAWGPC
jgi:hypothetical protein